MKTPKRGEVYLHPAACRSTDTIKQVTNSTGRKATVSPCGKKVLLVPPKPAEVRDQHRRFWEKIFKDDPEALADLDWYYRETEK